ncbi:hypothetical protein [Chryseobacterium polytrichastri]|uniref:hypothetical protein n=1 Tax=Chryseobacterium polytrichastri TaxID=1302687 RepID=UPI001587D06E|nr:hypothetical protein [Chryseobacterium polytrichastri]
MLKPEDALCLDNGLEVFLITTSSGDSGAVDFTTGSSFFSCGFCGMATSIFS